MRVGAIDRDIFYEKWNLTAVELIAAPARSPGSCHARRQCLSLAIHGEQYDSPRARAVFKGALTGRPMKRIDERELRDELVKLRAEHRELDDQIILLEDSPTADQLLVKRLKKKKLAIKDRMTAIEDQLLPDIIA
jgi:hypothetical protein